METSYATTTTHSTATTSVTTTAKTDKNGASKETTLFQELKNEKKDPLDITYEEYKELTREDIYSLYPKETMEEENKEALSLHIKANMTDDEVLNKVLFEKEVESLNSINKEALKSSNEVTNMMFEVMTGMARLSMMHEAMAKHLESFMVKKGVEVESYAFEFSRTMEIKIGNVTRSVSYNQSTVYTKETGIDTHMVFTAFDSMSNQYKKVIDDHHYGEDSYFYQGTKAVMSYHDDIKNEYNKRVETNNTLLYSYTKSCSYSKTEYLNYNQNMADIREDYKNRFSEEKYLELLDILGLGDISDEEKELFKTIIEDKHISNNEVRNLSYDQMKTLNKIIMQEDSDEDYKSQDVLDIDYKAGRLLDTTFLSDDDIFNKVIFEEVKGMHNDDGISIYMAMVSGSWNFPATDSIFKDNNPAEVLEKLISNDKTKQEGTTDTALDEYYDESIEIYTNILESYKEKIQESKEEE